MLQENEKWIPGMEGRYAASMDGEIISYRHKRRRVMAGAVTYNRKRETTTYRILTMPSDKGPKTYTYHRIIAETFIPNPENKATVNHINGDKLDNRVCNLEWATQKENLNHARETGLMPNLYLDEEIRRERSIKFILTGDTGGLTFETIIETLIAQDFMECHIPMEMVTMKNTHGENIPIKIWSHYIDVFTMLENKVKNIDIANITGLDYTMISKIKNGHRAQDAKVLYDKYGKDPYYLVNYVKQYDY